MKYLKFPKFRRHLRGVVSMKLLFIVLKTSLELLQVSNGNLYIVQGLLHLYRRPISRQILWKCHGVTSIWKMEAGSKNRLATSMRRLQVSYVGHLRPESDSIPRQSYLHEDDDPGGGVVVTTVGVHQAHRVHQRGQQGPQLGEIYALNTLQG